MENDVTMDCLEANIEDERVYGRILFASDGEMGKTSDKITVQVSLVNDYMLKLDNKWLRSDIIEVEKYHPYFYEFFAEISLKEMEGIKKRGLADGRILPMYLTDAVRNGDFSWYGEVIFAASPIIRKRKYLTFSKDEKDSCHAETLFQQTYGTWQSIKDFLNQKGECCKPFDGLVEIPVIGGSVYNVGQGNFVRFDCSWPAKQTILFDAGMTHRQDDLDNPEIKAALHEIGTLYPDVIILSHWDIDHILGVTALPCGKIYGECTWMAPDITLLAKSEISLSAMRLCFYLCSRHKILLVSKKDNTNGTTPDSNWVKEYANMEIFQGDGKRSANNRKNNIGLQVFIHNHPYCRYAVFMGDCDYDSLALGRRPSLRHCDFLLTAHHGSKNALFPKEKLCNFSHKPQAKCVISVGKNNYGHPHEEHIKSLRDAGFEDIWETRGNRRIDFYVGQNNIWAERIGAEGKSSGLHAFGQTECFYDDNDWSE